MARDSDAERRPTHREYLTYGGALAAAGLVAGCTSGADAGDAPEETPERTESETATATPTETATATAAAETSNPSGDASYSVTMEPVGTVEFDGVPKEPFYEMDAELHLIDPHALTDWLQAWDQSDLEEVRNNVAPFVGNLIFRRPDEWHDYRYYTLYEAFEKVATVFQQRERFEAFQQLHDEFIADHPVGSQLTAVRNGRVYRGGYLHQGPIHNLFLTERAAKQLYPDTFGAVTGDDELFDRQRVADVVTGAFSEE